MLKSDIRNSQHLLPGLTGTGDSTRCSLFREGGQICRRQQISRLQCRACMNLCYESKKPEKISDFQFMMTVFPTIKVVRFANLTETGAVVLNFPPGQKILNIPTVSTHYRMQKYVNKICLQILMTEIYDVCLHTTELTEDVFFSLIRR